MKTMIARFFYLVIFMTMSFVAQAREAVPLVDYPDNTVITGSGKTLKANQVKNAIVAAAQSRNWQISSGNHGNSLQAQLNVRGKHTVIVKIDYSTKAYAILYQGSSNMKFSEDAENKSRVIHPFYNRWVSELRDAIRLELTKL